MQIIPADQRVTDPRGAKLLIVGPTGVGKTSLLRTLDPNTTLFIDIEAGDLAVQDLAVTLRPRTWPRKRKRISSAHWALHFSSKQSPGSSVPQ